MKYQSYWKSQFEAFLSELSNHPSLSPWREVSRKIQDETMPIQEYVYELSIDDSASSIIIFSSVDKSSDRTRALGSDAVRVIQVWHTKKGPIYRKIQKRLRVSSLFENLTQTIHKTLDTSDDLSLYQWGTLSEALS